MGKVHAGAIVQKEPLHLPYRRRRRMLLPFSKAYIYIRLVALESTSPLGAKSLREDEVVKLWYSLEEVFGVTSPTYPSSLPVFFIEVDGFMYKSLLPATSDTEEELSRKFGHD